MAQSLEASSDATVAGPAGPPSKNVMDRFIDSIEWIAAFFVGIVALNTFTAVFMRKFFAVTIPDYYNFGQFLLGILIFWGIAATSYRGTHITLDLVWANSRPKYQRWIDVLATLAVRRARRSRRQPHRHHGFAGSGVAVLPGGVDRRRLRRAADRDQNVSA